MHHHRQPGGGRGRVRQSPPFPVALRGGQVPGGSRAPAPRFPTRLGGNGDGGARGARAGGVPPCPPRGGDARRRAAGGGYVTTLRSTMSPAARGGGEAAGPAGNLPATRRWVRRRLPRLPLRPASAARPAARAASLRLPGTQLTAAARYGARFFVLPPRSWGRFGGLCFGVLGLFFFPSPVELVGCSSCLFPRSPAASVSAAGGGTALKGGGGGARRQSCPRCGWGSPALLAERGPCRGAASALPGGALPFFPAPRGPPCPSPGGFHPGSTSKAAAGSARCPPRAT